MDIFNAELIDELDKELIKDLQTKFKFIDIDTENDSIKIKYELLTQNNKEKILKMLEMIENTEEKMNQENIEKIKSTFDTFNKMFPSYANKFDVCYDNKKYYVNFMIENLSCGYMVDLKTNKICHVDRLMSTRMSCLDFTSENIYIMYKEKIDKVDLINKIKVNDIWFTNLYDKVSILEYFLKSEISQIQNEDINDAIDLINKIFSRIKYGEINIVYNVEQCTLFTTNMNNNFLDIPVTAIDKFINDILSLYPHLKIGFIYN
jgi:hypothetical protein